MLAGTPVKPPQLDEFFCANEAHLRARELAEIGLSEQRRSSHEATRCGHACCSPSLPLDVFARAQSPADAHRPFAVGSGGHYPRVVAANAAARDAGIRDDQLDLRRARARARPRAARSRRRGRKPRALAQLATWALTFTPMACLAPPDAVVAEIGASLRLFGGLPRLVARASPAARTALGYANAPRHRAHAGRRAACSRVRHREAGRTTCARLPRVWHRLPLASLDVADATRDTLREAGVTTFGQAAALPRDGLARRFGDDVVDRIDRALGRSARSARRRSCRRRVRGTTRPAGAGARRRGARRSACSGSCATSRTGSPPADWAPCA